MKVEIEPDGIHAKEVNPFEHPEALDPAWDMKRKRFTEAESMRKVYEIEGTEKVNGKSYQRGHAHKQIIGLKPGTIHEAELLENGKIKII